MGCSIIQYKNKEILYFGHTGLNGEDLINNLKLAYKMMREYRREEMVYIAHFNKDTYINKEAMEIFKSKEVQELQNRVVKKSAVVGMTGIKRIFLNAFNAIMQSKIRAFSTMEEAKEYLIK